MNECIAAQRTHTRVLSLFGYSLGAFVCVGMCIFVCGCLNVCVCVCVCVCVSNSSSPGRFEPQTGSIPKVLYCPNNKNTHQRINKDYHFLFKINKTET